MSGVGLDEELQRRGGVLGGSGAEGDGGGADGVPTPGGGALGVPWGDVGGNGAVAESGGAPGSAVMRHAASPLVASLSGCTTTLRPQPSANTASRRRSDARFTASPG